VVGGYVAAARWWRRLLLVSILPLGAVAFWFVVQRQGWTWHEGTILYVCIAMTLISAGVTAWASAPLLLQQRLGVVYAVSSASTLLRLAGCGVLHAAGLLDAVTLTVLGAAVSAASAQCYWKAARRDIDEPRRSQAAVRTEIGRYVAPLVPLAVFYAVQGQLATFMIAWFGQAQQIAEVTALGRLAQLFAFLSALFSAVVMPYFGRVEAGVFLRRYRLVVACVLGLAAILSAVAFVLPEPLLWLLGRRYDHLLREVGWVVLAGSLSFAAGAISSVHAIRKWVFWRGTAQYIVCVTVAQGLFMAFVPLDTTLHVLLLGVVASATSLLAQVPIAWMGLARDARAAADR
jgi:O-antigen/teichoic acid export membrane protein